MKILAFVVAATIFEAVGDAVMRIALRSPYALPGRIALFALASVLLSMYGLFLNLAPVEFATVTGIYLASLFLAFQIVNYIFFRHVPSFGVPEERRIHSRLCGGKSNHARTTANPRAPARQINAKVGADRPASERVPELPGFSGKAEFLAATCQVSADRGAARFDVVVRIPAALEAGGVRHDATAKYGRNALVC